MERALIANLRRRPPPQGVLLGIGDDAAVLPPSGEPVLWTTDLLTEGVDFLLAETDPRRIGRKALAANLSDIAAMGGLPTAYLVALALPQNGAMELAELLYEGMTPLEEKYGVTLVGGDTNCWDGGLVVSITVLGQAGPGGVWKRSGGKSDDVLLATGSFGGSILERQFSFEPRVFEAIYLNENHDIHAAMDVSDGLSLDVFRLATESGLGATLFPDEIPVAETAYRLAQQTGRSPLDHALSDGEDFELILAVDPDEAKTLLKTQPLENNFGTKLHRIGVLTMESGLRPFPPKGFEH